MDVPIENWLLKVRNQDFSIATCQTYVDLPKMFFNEKFRVSVLDTNSRKSAIFHSIKLPFEAEVAEKLLNGI